MQREKYSIAAGFFVAAILCLTPLIHADTVTLKSGTVLEGTIVERGDRYLIINREGSIETYFLNEVRSIVSPATPLDVQAAAPAEKPAAVPVADASVVAPVAVAPIAVPAAAIASSPAPVVAPEPALKPVVALPKATEEKKAVTYRRAEGLAYYRTALARCRAIVDACGLYYLARGTYPQELTALDDQDAPYLDKTFINNITSPGGYFSYKYDYKITDNGHFQLFAKPLGEGLNAIFVDERGVFHCNDVSGSTIDLKAQ